MKYKSFLVLMSMILTYSSSAQNVKIKTFTDRIIEKILIIDNSTGEVDTVSYNSRLKLDKSKQQTLLFVTDYYQYYLKPKKKKIRVNQDDIRANECVYEDGSPRIYFTIENNTSIPIYFFHAKPINTDKFSECLHYQASERFGILPNKSIRIDFIMPKLNRNKPFFDLKAIGMDANGKIYESLIYDIDANESTISINNFANKR